MSRQNEIAGRMAEAVVKRLVARKLAEIKDEARAREVVRHVLSENFLAEEKIDKEVKTLLLDHAKLIKDSASDYRRLFTLAKTKLEQQSHGTSNGTTQPATEQAQVQPQNEPVETPVESEPVVSSVALPMQSEQAGAPGTHSEAPASCNAYIDIAGRKVQFTLRDDNEEHLLARMEKLLSRFPLPEQEPAEPASVPTPPENWCPIHQVSMKRYSNAKGSWLSHKTPEGPWCNGKRNGK
jgi:hypothetical protein